MKYCSNCGKQLNENNSFCPNCGAKVINSQGNAGGQQTQQNFSQTGGAQTNYNQQSNYGYQGYNQQSYGQYNYGAYGSQAAEPELSLFEYFKKCFEHYADFNGRARRKEYWGFVLFYCIFYFVAYIFAAIIDSIIGIPIFTAIIGLASLGAIVPALAVLVRRLHDIGKSGWWYFISFVPLIGTIWLLVLLCTEGVRDYNMYGAPTK